MQFGTEAELSCMMLLPVIMMNLAGFDAFKSQEWWGKPGGPNPFPLPQVYQVQLPVLHLSLAHQARHPRR
jgi:hypothetical protein